ncbi:hypothetical protein B0H13DRAFT_2453190 [Mycena leptocephala]|nr:hypothetical protein B0H13DRAFT_2453190 [Mycena leptocephala]
MTAISAALLVLIITAYSVLTFLPVRYMDCPYRTPLSAAFWRLLQSSKAIWTRRPTSAEGAMVEVNPSRNKTMVEAMIHRASEHSLVRRERDYRALVWTLRSLADDVELEPFVEGLPDVLWSHKGQRHTYSDHIRRLVNHPESLRELFQWDFVSRRDELDRSDIPELLQNIQSLRDTTSYAILFEYFLKSVSLKNRPYRWDETRATILIDRSVPFSAFQETLEQTLDAVPYDHLPTGPDYSWVDGIMLELFCFWRPASLVVIPHVVIHYLSHRNSDMVLSTVLRQNAISTAKSSFSPSTTALIKTGLLTYMSRQINANIDCWSTLFLTTVTAITLPDESLLHRRYDILPSVQARIRAKLRVIADGRDLRQNRPDPAQGTDPKAHQIRFAASIHAVFARAQSAELMIAIVRSKSLDLYAGVPADSWGPRDFRGWMNLLLTKN